MGASSRSKQASCAGQPQGSAIESGQRHIFRLTLTMRQSLFVRRVGLATSSFATGGCAGLFALHWMTPPNLVTFWQSDHLLIYIALTAGVLGVSAVLAPTVMRQTQSVVIATSITSVSLGIIGIVLNIWIVVGA